MEEKETFSKHELVRIAEEIGAGAKNHCHFCKEDNKEVLDQHHIVPKRLSGSNGSHNLVKVCRNCHGKLEQLYDAETFSMIAHQIKESKSQEQKLRDVAFP